MACRSGGGAENPPYPPGSNPGSAKAQLQGSQADIQGETAEAAAVAGPVCVSPERVPGRRLALLTRTATTSITTSPNADHAGPDKSVDGESLIVDDMMVSNARMSGQQSVGAAPGLL